MIPRVFHFVFGLRPQNEPFHLMHYLCLASCIEVNEPEQVVFHYYNEPWGPWWDRIKQRLVLRKIHELEQLVVGFSYKNSCMGKYRYAHLADFVRLQVLQQEGGVYADIDTLFVRPLGADILEKQFVLGREKPPPEAVGGSLCNAWIASVAGAEFGRLWLEQSYDAFDGTWSGHSTLLPYKLYNDNPGLLHVEPEKSFYAFDWTSKGINDLFLRRKEDLEGIYSIHLWNHLWWDRYRVDFSRFHSGMLTPEYVAYADTTYAHLARPFLPEGCTGSRNSFRFSKFCESLLAPTTYMLGKAKTFLR